MYMCNNYNYTQSQIYMYLLPRFTKNDIYTALIACIVRGVGGTLGIKISRVSAQV